MQRGELYRYVRPSSPEAQRTVVVLSGSGINRSSRPWLLGLEPRDRDPGDVLAVPIGDGRFAYPGDLNRLYRAGLGGRAGRLDTTTLARLDSAVRAALDLSTHRALRPRAGPIVAGPSIS
jgi:mRNA interferase MazF